MATTWLKALTSPSRSNNSTRVSGAGKRDAWLHVCWEHGGLRLFDLVTESYLRSHEE